ncbi:MAG: glycerophosphodiester phosphodiesterase [Clostridia bacterium]|nr:glycerophosphodiester phosphodiesterase [Clostridia bacterium]
MKKQKGLKIFGIIVLAVALFFVIINIIPPKQNVENNPFRLKEGQKTMIAAHRGGSINNPENTVLAFTEAVKTIEVDVLEGDLYLTKDGYLVYNHDSYIDRTCNVNGDISLNEVETLCEDKNNRHYIENYTLAELKQFNFGYYFKDEKGERIYKNAQNVAEQGLQIATVDQVFELFYQSHPNLLFIIEIKNSGERGREASRILANLLEEYPNYKDQVAVSSFNDEVADEFKSEYPELLRGAPLGTAAKFILTHYLGVNIFYNNDFACLQIPTSYDVGVEIPLVSKGIIRRAHRRNIAVQYWTINDADEMRMLIELGADCIMTDNPKLLKEVLEEYK